MSQQKTLEIKPLSQGFIFSVPGAQRARGRAPFPVQLSEQQCRLLAAAVRGEVALERYGLAPGKIERARVFELLYGHVKKLDQQNQTAAQRASVSRMLRRLEEQGLIEPFIGRRNWWLLTNPGKRVGLAFCRHLGKRSVFTPPVRAKLFALRQKRLAEIEGRMRRRRP